jgi:hypothetical protein
MGLHVIVALLPLNGLELVEDYYVCRMLLSSHQCHQRKPETKKTVTRSSFTAHGSVLVEQARVYAGPTTAYEPGSSWG